MSFAALLTNSMTVSRLVQTQGVRQEYQVLDVYPCHITPLDAMAAAQQGVVLGSAFRAFVAITSDVRPSDQVVDEAGNRYSVVGVMERRFGATPHRVATLQLESGK